MRLKRTNIEAKLAKAKAKDSDQILLEVRRLLQDDVENRDRIKKNMDGGSPTAVNAFDFDLLETNRIYHLDQIRTICIDYRLRFLDSKYFKGEIPVEAVSKTKRLENEHHIEVKGFKVVAPSKLFRLEDKDDPLLFVPIGNNYFYLIHKWGNDLHPFRRVLAWPFKSIVNLALLILAITYLCTALLPVGLFSREATNGQFWIVFFFMFKSIAAVVLFYGVALGKDFNPAIWNSRYLKT